MANDVSANPLRCDTAATIITSSTGELVQAMQWVDDTNAAGGVIANTEDLIMTVNGVLVEFTIVAVATQLSGAIAWELTLPAPIRVYSLIVTAIDGGTLLIWKA